MLGSLADLKNSDQQSDVVIVGGGAAGLTLAHALGAAGKSVLLLEAGGDKRTKASQEFYRGDLTDKVVHPPTDNYRVRAIGGTSTIWGGRAIPFDPIDFEKRDWVPVRAGPFGRETLAGYYETGDGRRGGRPAGLLPGTRSARRAEGTRTRPRRRCRPDNGRALQQADHFWRRYGDELTRSIASGSSRTRQSSTFSLPETAVSVDWIEVASPDGTRTKVRGRSCTCWR